MRNIILVLVIILIVLLVLGADYYLSGIYNYQESLTSKNFSFLNEYFSQVYVITLPQRKEYIQQIMEAIKVDCIYFPAILKQKINREHLISLGLISPQNLLNNAQIACHLSHITILKKFLKSSARNCLIFEDDISMPQVNKINLPEMLSLIPSDYDIIYLGRCWDSCRRSVSLNRQIVKCHAPQCFHSYGVSREGAKKIIKYTKALIKPPDLTISEYIRSGKITAYAPKKSIFYQNRQEITSHLTEDRVTQKDCV